MAQHNISPPRFVFMEVNKRCNLKCTHCDFWRRKDDEKALYLSIHRKRQLLGEFAGMNPNGTLVICGGEPMLDFDEYFALCKAARDNSLRIVSVVNGTRIRRAEIAERMILEGPHEISISLNSHVEALHDETRGVKGAFQKATKAIRLLVDAKKRLGLSETRIYVMGLIFGRNVELIEGFYDFVLNDLGADQLKLNFLQPSFGQIGEIDPFFEAESNIDAGRLRSILLDCDQKFSLDLNSHWIDQAHMYFDSLRKIDPDAIARGWGAGTGTDDHICNTYERNVMIDHYGTARLCFSTAFPGRSLREAGDFTDFWNKSASIRSKMRRCNQFCGISHSVRRESSTLKGRDKMVEHEALYGAFAVQGIFEEMLDRLRSVVR